MGETITLVKCQGCDKWYCRELGCYYDVEPEELVGDL